MDGHQAAQDFAEKYAKLRQISAQLAPWDEKIMSQDLSMAHMEVAGTLDEYTNLSRERGQIVSELKQIRSEAGDEAILSGLTGVEGGEQAVEYIQKVPLIKNEGVVEVRKETRKGLFGRFR